LLSQHGGNVGIELSALAIQRHHRDVDWKDETQAVNVLAQIERQRVILRGLCGW
jgi:hypothetical protein